MDFKDGGHCGHLASLNGMILAILVTFDLRHPDTSC